jgi:hypothetical protein
VMDVAADDVVRAVPPRLSGKHRFELANEIDCVLDLEFRLL